MKIKYAILIPMFISIEAYAEQDDSFKVNIGYASFKNNLTNVSVSPGVLSIGLEKQLHPRISLGGRYGFSISDSTASDSFQNLNAGTSLEIDYTGSIESEIAAYADFYLIGKDENKFKPYLKLGVSSVKSELEVVSIANSGVPTTSVVESSSSGITYGFGFLMSAGESWALRAEYIDIAHDDETSATKLNFGIQKTL